MAFIGDTVDNKKWIYGKQQSSCGYTAVINWDLNPGPTAFHALALLTKRVQEHSHALNEDLLSSVVVCEAHLELNIQTFEVDGST